MREILGLAWKRFNLIVGIIGDAQGRLIATLFYYTIFMPFGIISRLTSDPLRMKDETGGIHWTERHPIPTDLESAKRQG